MDCPSCHGENADEAVACSRCGRSLRAGEAATIPPRRSSPRAHPRRRNTLDSEAANNYANPAALRAYHVALWALIPGVGLLLGLVAVLLGYRAMRGSGDLSSRNRAKAALLLGVFITLTQWLGVALMVYDWRR